MSSEQTTITDNTGRLRSKSYRLNSVLLGILIIGGGAWCWQKFIKDQIFPKNFGVVEQGLVYRSGQISAMLIRKTLIKYKIGVIIDLRLDKDTDVNQNAEKQAAGDLNIKRLVLPLRGNGTGDLNKYAQAIAVIVEAKHANTPILIHCAGGTMRTGGIIAAYQLLVEHKDANLVYKELKHYGWKTKDVELSEYLNRNMRQLADMLYQMHVIERIPSPLPQLPQK